MKLYKHLLFAFCLIPTFVYSQNLATVENYGDIQTTPFSYLLGDSVIVRECPASTCGLVKVFRIGDKVKLLKRSDSTSTIGGIDSYWYQIKEGWIWGGLIAQSAFRSETDPSIIFLFGRNLNSDKSYQIRTLKNTTIIARTEFNSFAHSFYNAKSLGNKGLKNVNDIISLDVPCSGGCGCTTGEMIIFWNGKKFSEPENLIGIADAWASEWTNFIYPSDMEGIPNRIIKSANFFIDSNENQNINRSIVTEYFIWTGEKLIPDTSVEKTVKNYLSKEN